MEERKFYMRVVGWVERERKVLRSVFEFWFVYYLLFFIRDVGKEGNLFLNYFWLLYSVFLKVIICIEWVIWD